MRILLLDDEPDLRLLLTRYLKAEGHEVVTAPDLATLSGMDLDSIRPEVFLLDLNLPDGSALDFAFRAREKYPEVPIVLQSAYLGQVSRAELEGLLVAGMLEKPYEFSELRDLLEQLEQRLNQAE